MCAILRLLVHLLSQLDFWAIILDLIGLTILMSHDIEFLKPVDRWIKSRKSSERWRTLDDRIWKALETFEEWAPPLQKDTQVDRFKGKDAELLIELFSNFALREISNEVDLCAYRIGPSIMLSRVFFWVASKGNPEPLTERLTQIAISVRIEKKQQNVTYSVGFSLMALSTLLLLVGIIVRNAV